MFELSTSVRSLANAWNRLITAQKSPHLQRTFRTREYQTSILWTVGCMAQKVCMKVTKVNMTLYQENLVVIPQLREGLKKSWYFQSHTCQIYNKYFKVLSLPKVAHLECNCKAGRNTVITDLTTIVFNRISKQSCPFYHNKKIFYHHFYS